MPFSDGFNCTLKLSCYSLKVYKGSVTVLYTMERTKMDDDNNIFFSQKTKIDCSLHITEGRLKNTDDVIFFLSFFCGGRVAVSEPHLP